MRVAVIALCVTSARACDYYVDGRCCTPADGRRKKPKKLRASRRDLRCAGWRGCGSDFEAKIRGDRARARDPAQANSQGPATLLEGAAELVRQTPVGETWTVDLRLRMRWRRTPRETRAGTSARPPSRGSVSFEFQPVAGGSGGATSRAPSSSRRTAGSFTCSWRPPTSDERGTRTARGPTRRIRTKPDFTRGASPCRNPEGSGPSRRS